MVKFNFGLEGSTEINEQQKATEQQADQAAAQITANDQSVIPEGLAIENEEALITTAETKQEINEEAKGGENNIPQNTSPIINPQPILNNSISFGVPEKNTNISPQNNQGRNVSISESLIKGIKGIKEEFKNMVKNKENEVNHLKTEKEKLIIKFEEDKKNIEKLITKKNKDLAEEKDEFYKALRDLSHLPGDEKTKIDPYAKKGNNPNKNRRRT
jgi:hypothetical protein